MLRHTYVNMCMNHYSVYFSADSNTLGEPLEATGRRL